MCTKYKVISISQLNKLLSTWGAGQDVEESYFLVEPCGNNCYITVDNTSGEFFIEEFRSKALCLEYFNGEDLGELYRKNYC